jgi:hypothetical protein
MSEVAEKTHALLSPSGAHRWTRCPGSVVLEQGMPDSSSSYARWGTCAHEVAGMILEKVIDTRPGIPNPPVWNPENAEAYVGRVFQIEGHDVEFDMEMADCVNDYVAHVESFWAPGDTMLVEQVLPLEQLTGERDATGTSDCVIIKSDPNELVVIDLKGGKGVQVDAEDNEQGLMYAAGAVHEYDLIHGPFTRIRIVIIQPRCQSVSEWVLEWSEFLERIEELKKAELIVGLAQSADVACNINGTAPAEDFLSWLHPGEKQCRFCKAKAICPALQGEVSGALALTAAPARAEDFPDLSLPKQASAAIPEQMSLVNPEQLAKAWKAIPLIEQWINAIRETVHAELHDGREVGDLCLYEGKQGSRGWSDETQAEAILKKSRVPADEMYTKKVISYPAAEKLLKSKPKVWAKLAPLVNRADGKPVVGIMGDEKRRLWSPAAPEEFPDLSLEDAQHQLAEGEEDELYA